MDNPFAHLSTTQKYAVTGGSVIILGYLVVSHHSKTGSWNPFNSGNNAANSSTAIDPITGMAYSQDNVTDPVTGETYLAEADQYGSVQAAEASVTAFGQSTASGSGIPVNPASPLPSGSVNTPVGSSVYTSDAAWAQAVQAGLEDISGSAEYDGTDIGSALGDYLTQQPLTPAQAQVVSVGIAEFGPPPQGNLQIILKPVTTPVPKPPITKPGVRLVRVPDVTGLAQEDADQRLSEDGLHAVNTPFPRNTPRGSVMYVTSTSPRAGSEVAPGSSVRLHTRLKRS